MHKWKFLTQNQLKGLFHHVRNQEYSSSGQENKGKYTEYNKFKHILFKISSFCLKNFKFEIIFIVYKIFIPGSPKTIRSTEHLKSFSNKFKVFHPTAECQMQWH